MSSVPLPGGLITGIPATAGTYSVPVTATDTLAASGSATLSIVINPAPSTLTITTASLPAATAGLAYTAQLTASGGTLPYSWSATGLSGTGFAIASGGAITGTATSPTTLSLTITVTDSASPPQTATATRGLTVNAATPPGAGIVYNLRTDRAILQPAPLTAPAAAGQSVVDPTFNTTITRITDPSSAVNSVDWATFKNVWSSDDQYFSADGHLFTRSGQDLGYVYDGYGNAFTVWFAFQSPNLLFGAGGAAGGFGVVQKDFLANIYTLLYNLDGGSFPNRTQYGGASGIVVCDYADNRFAMYFNGDSQDRFRTVMVWEKSSNTYCVLDLDAQLAGGWFPAGSPWTSHTSSMGPLVSQKGAINIPNLMATPGASNGFHSVEIDRTGRYLWLGSNGPGADNFIWDVNNPSGPLVAWSGVPVPAGHSCLGFAEVVNLGGGEDTLGNWSPTSIWLRPAALAGLVAGTGRVQLIQPPLAPGEYQGNQDAHISWASNRPGQHTPILRSQYLGGDSSYSSPSAIPTLTLWDQEIIAVDPDTFTVYRVCHHRSWYQSTDGNTAPHGNVSRAGDKFIFNSNWMGTLQGGRSDIFMVDLPILTRRR